jgi:hypothetical protein
MDQSSVLVACIGVAVTAAFTTKCFFPAAKIVKVNDLDYDLKDDEDEDEEEEEEEDDDDDDDDDEDVKELVKNDDVYDDLPELESGEIIDDEMPPLIPINSVMPDLEECEYVSQDEFDSRLKAILVKIDKYHDAMEKALENAIDDKLIDDKIDHLRKELNTSVELDMMESSMQLEEKIMKNIKELFIPLHAKKDLDKSNYQGWKGEAARDSVTLQIAVKNTTYTTYEENDAWIDLTNNSDDSIKYRDSLLGLHDNASWSYSMNDTKTNASLTKRYVTLGWNHSVGISVIINNMPLTPKIDDNGIKTQAMELLKQLSSSIVWKRVLVPTQTNNA